MDYKVNDRLIETLKTFSKSDVKNFRKFLRSSFLNPYPKSILLFDALMGFYPEFDTSGLNRIEIFRKMKTPGVYNDSTMRDLISKLKYLLDKYMAYLSFEDNEFDYLAQLRHQMHLRKLYNHIDRNIAETEKTLMLSTGADSDYFYKKFKVETEKFNNYVINKKINNRQNLNDSVTSLNNAAKNQLAMFILETIKHNDNILKITKRQEVTGSRNIIPELLKPIEMKKIIVTLKKYEVDLSHIFQIYYYLYMLFSSRDSEKYFHLYKESIIKNSEKMDIDELHFLYGRLIDFCVNKCNEGKTGYYTELFNAYGIMLEKKYYTNKSNKYIAQDLFRNIFQTAIRTNNLKWAEDFINRYRKELHPQNRDNMYYYCYSYIYFETGILDKSLEFILKIKQDYFALKIDIKILLLKIYFELGHYEQIYNQLDSFKHFITNHELVFPTKRKKIKDFIKLYEKVLKATLKEDADTGEFLYKELSAKDDKQFFKWLLMKAEHIKNFRRRA
jgi:hypothetical protein